MDVQPIYCLQLHCVTILCDLESGLDAFGQPALPAVPNDIPVPFPTPDYPHRSTITAAADTNERYLDSEVVAIYW